MNLNMKITRSRGEMGRMEAETYEGELIANEIIKNGDSFQRCNNSNYDPAALLSVFGENVYDSRVTLLPLLLLRIDSYEFS